MMNPETEKALRESKSHWERLEAGNSNDTVDGSECALCRRFVLVNGFCGGCPISERTGQPLCDGTPFSEAQFDFHMNGKHSEPFKTSAAAMVEFLNSLLPKCKCGNEPLQNHLCPYKQDIRDSNEECNCCLECVNQCRCDI